MEIILEGHENHYSLRITKSDREKEGWVYVQPFYRDNPRGGISVRPEELANALKAFTP